MKTARKEQLSYSLQQLPTLAWDTMYLPKPGSLGYTLFRTRADFTFPWTTHFYHAVQRFLHPFCVLLRWALPLIPGRPCEHGASPADITPKSNAREGTETPNPHSAHAFMHCPSHKLPP